MKELKKYNTCLKRINEFSQNLGIKKEDQTILELKKTQKENEKLLVLKNGSFDGPEPWFIVDENDEIHTLVSLKSLKNILENLKHSNFILLESALERINKSLTNFDNLLVSFKVKLISSDLSIIFEFGSCNKSSCFA